MKLSKKQEPEVRKTYDAYWESYFAGDEITFASVLDDEFRMIGTSENEICHNKADAIEFLRAQTKELGGKAELRNREIQVAPVNGLMLVSEIADTYVLIDAEWRFYSKIRLSTFLHNTASGWKIVHQHGSMPDSKVQDGETLALEHVKTENLQLRDAVKRRTVELEHKNRELEIEAALERVRSRTMGMQRSEELKEVIQVVYEQFALLNIHIDHTGFVMDYKTRDDYHIWIADRVASPTQVTIPYFDCVYYNQFNEAKKQGLDFFATNLTFEEKNRFYQDLFKHVPGLPEEALEFLLTCPGLAASTVLLENVCLYIENFSGIPYTEEENNTLMRFGNVFQQTYTRFLDLQKAEAQTREAQIEAALERVRSRTMAMQHSDELAETAQILFQKFKELGENPIQIAIGIVHESQGEIEFRVTDWIGGGAQVNRVFNVSIEEPTMMKRLFAGWKEQKKSIVIDLTGKELQDWIHYRNQLSGVSDANHDAATRRVVTVAYFSKGLTLISTPEPRPHETIQLLERFTGVFELSYTRFLDLKNAEAQAREARIETALERTRTQSMIMQHSKELDDTLRVFHEQVLWLGIHSAFSFLWLPDEEKDRHIFWAVWGEDLPAGQAGKNDSTVFKNKAINYPLDRNEPATAQCLVDWKSNEPVYSYHVPPAAVENYFATWQELIDRVEQLKPEYFSGGLYYVEAFMKYGCFGVMVATDLTEDEKKVLGRFAIEFERTYTRFLDLQKAEAQTREAQIEASLERVRSKAMAMHKSEDLSGAVAAVFGELDKLSLGMLRCGIGILDKEKPKGDIWITVKSEHGDTVQVSGDETLDVHPLLLNAYQAWQRQEDYYYVLQGKYLASYYKALTATQFQSQISETFHAEKKDQQQYYFNAVFQDGCLFAFLETPITDEVKLVMKRFAGVFNLTYKRFLDLQKAEAQTREAQIEASLERVRAHAMAMHNSADLSATVNIFFKELKTLGITPMRCGVGEMLEETHTSDLVFTTADKQGELYELPGKLLHEGHPVVENIYNYWIRQEEYHPVLQGADINAYYKVIKSQMTLPDYPDYTIHFGNYFYFKEGFFFAWAEKEFTEEAMNIFRKFTSVLSLTYKRYKDLKLAETQAREATIEAALEKVRGKAMAMNDTKDLSSTILLAFSELNKLGIRPLRFGVGLINREQRKAQLYAATSSEDGVSLALMGWVLFEGHPVLESIFDSWVKGEDYFPILEGQQLKSYYELLAPGLSVPKLPDWKGGEKQYGHFFPLPVSCLYAWADQSYQEPDVRILKRFASIVELTFKRYLELQKSEASARDAIRQASLDRVRAEIASMRTTADLERITPLIWNELTTLGVPFIRCGVFIMDDTLQQIYTFLSTPDGKAIAAFHLPYETPGPTAHVLAHWRRKEMYRDHWDEAAFKAWTKNLVEQGAIADSEKYLTANHPTNLHLHFLPFLQGMLYTGSETPLNAEELFSVQNLADAFSTAYARYEDFNRLEAAKKKTEQALSDLESAKDQLVQQEKLASLGQLTAGIAHEIKNPLNFVNNFSEVSIELLDEMLEELEKGNSQSAKSISEDIKSNLNKIHEHGSRADSIVKSMLLHSRGGSGQKEPTDLNALIREYVNLTFHGMRAGKQPINVKIELNLDETLGKVPLIVEDISRVIVNLCNNAFDAMRSKLSDPSQRSYIPKLTVRTKRNANHALIEIVDNGPGIPEDIKDKILQPFFTTKKGTQGTGLGLSITNDIVKAHGGELKVETKEGEGSEFIMILPIV